MIYEQFKMYKLYCYSSKTHQILIKIFLTQFINIYTAVKKKVEHIYYKLIFNNLKVLNARAFHA